MVWEYITDAWDNFISFEWLSEIWEFITGIFDNMGEFSIAGAVFAAISFAIVFLLRKQMLTPFLNNMGSGEAIFWGGLTYLSCAIAGYLIGKKMFEE